MSERERKREKERERERERERKRERYIYIYVFMVVTREIFACNAFFPEFNKISLIYIYI